MEFHEGQEHLSLDVGAAERKSCVMPVQESRVQPKLLIESAGVCGTGRGNNLL